MNVTDCQSATTPLPLTADPDHGMLADPLFYRHLPPLPDRAVIDAEGLRQLLSGRLVKADLYETLQSEAIRLQLPVDCLLIEGSFLEDDVIYRELAGHCGVPLLERHEAGELWLAYEDIDRFLSGYYRSHLFQIKGGVAICPRGLAPQTLVAYINQLQAALGAFYPDGRAIVRLVSPLTVRQAMTEKFSAALLDHARDGLNDEAPHMSARGGPAVWQWLALLFGLGAAVASYAYQPSLTVFSLSVFFAVFFFLLISLRIAAAMMQSRLSQGFQAQSISFDGPEADLPTYTILVPLFHEANMLPQLIKALEGLDYPKARLDIKLLIEAVDTETRLAIDALRLPPRYHIITVPDARPRTKPKALNYGAALARGDYVVIYDAEDIPAPDQLKCALGQFAIEGPDVAALQAKLNFYNQRLNWLTRQFTVEYCSLFDGLLPAFQLLDFPLPLGGTSNHFRRHALIEAGGWDAYNVTEDADLGIRLYRRGFRAKVLSSSTFEEATHRPHSWIRQRTRWLKGWVQTYFVHMRRPFTLLQELGFWRFLGFQAIIGGPIIASLAHPVFLGILFWQLPYERLPQDLWLLGLLVLSIFNLFAGYLATMWLGLITLRLRHISGLFMSILTIPFYWLLISVAAYRAFLQLCYAPFYWEKTHHLGKDPSSHS